MKVLIIFDSIFGNTEKIAQAIGNRIRQTEEVEVFRVSEIKPEQLRGVDLLVCGSPTRGFRPTPAMVDFLKTLPANSLKNVRTASFDTRLSLPDIESSAVRFIVKTGGYAAKRISDHLKKKGAILIKPPEGFLVTSEEGPLKEGELERATEWAKSLLV